MDGLLTTEELKKIYVIENEMLSHTVSNNGVKPQRMDGRDKRDKRDFEREKAIVTREFAKIAEHPFHPFYPC